MKNYISFLLGLLCFSTTVFAQPSNDDPCNAKIILPTQLVCNAYEDNAANSTTSLIGATVTTGFGVVDVNCDYTSTPDLYDVWFKMPFDAANLIIKTIPIPGFDVAFQVYYKQSGTCATNDFLLDPLICGNISAAGIADSVSIPSFYHSFIDTLFIRIYHHPDGTGPAPINNSQFSICAYYPEPACSVNASPYEGEQVLSPKYLNWTYSAFATKYNVYLGSSPASAVFIGQTEFPNFDISSLNLPSGKYYWYIVPLNGSLAATTCTSSATSFTVFETVANNFKCDAIELFASPLSCTPFVDNSIMSTTSYYFSTYQEVDSGSKTCNAFNIDADVWFKFTAPESASYVIRVEPVAGINTSFRVFESSSDCAGTLTSLGCFNTGALAIVDTGFVNVRAGKQYFIQVFSQNGSRDFNPPGNSQFGICIYKPIPECVSPLLVDPANGSTTVDHITGLLTWKTVKGASRYDLYLGTTAQNMQLVNYTFLINYGTEIKLNFKDNFSNSSPFFPGVQYFWKVIPYNNDLVNTACAEEIGTFTTYACPPSLYSVGATITVNRSGELDYTMPCLNCPSSWLIFEYGPNSNQGTGTTAAVGNKVVYPVEQTFTWGYKGRVGIDSTYQIPSYKYFIRAVGCPYISGSYLSVNPGNVQSLTVCSTTAITIENGRGRWNFNGKYPVNSNGKTTPGKMAWFNFTPTQSGVYYLQADSLEITDTINYLYKVDSLNKYSPDNWTGIAAINKKGKYPIGFLTAGLTYHFVADSENDSLLNRKTNLSWQTRHFIKICEADVLSAPVTNTCIEANIYNPIPALSPKEEFAIDTSGRLIASIKSGADSLGMVSVSYYVNANGMRYDHIGTEYLDRNFTITPSNNPASAQQVKLFFTNAELTTLINVPDDGNADVNSINDLVVTKTDQPCSTSAAVGINGNLLIMPVERGAYNANSGYVSVPVNSFSTFYIHGGALAILPLRLLSFTVQKQNDYAALNWRTDNEVNTSHFVVEKSFTGATYSAIGNVPAANTTGVHNYRFTDQSPGKGVIFYRLKYVDINGNYKYSETRTVYFSDDLSIKVYPIITASVVTVYGITKGLVYTLFDMNGRVLMNGAAPAGNKEIDISSFATGMYLLKISDEEKNTQMFKIVKE